MESRGKRLVSMINKPKIPKDDWDEIPTSSNASSILGESNTNEKNAHIREYDWDERPSTSDASSILSESKKNIALEMERMFDSDDSAADPTYNPDPYSMDLIQPHDLFNMDDRQNAGDEVEILGESLHIEKEVLQLPDKEVENVHQIVISILENVLINVFNATRSRKRWKKAAPENWKVNIAKKRRAEGLTYTSRKKEKNAKIPKDINCEKCFYKCYEITSEERESLCRHYWNLSFVEQKNFILNNVISDLPKRVLAIRGPKKQRQFTKKCFFVHNGQKKQVCQKFFCCTLCISSHTVNDAVRKRNDLGLYKGNDNRGKHEPHNKTKEADLSFVRNHIESFPCMKPHYIRQTSKRLYLDASLSITKMHQLYKEKCIESNMIPVTEITYRRIFCNNYNFSFFVPKKDQCLVCSNYNKAQEDDKAELKTEFEEHIRRKERCNAEKAKDKERAGKEKQFCCVTFDLQAVLQIPSGLVGQLYYCRKLCVYNLCIYEAALPNDAFCFAWSELNGKRGSSEIGSILYHYLSTCVPPHVTEVCLYSDTCGGQNRNQYVAALLLFAVKNIPHISKIEHKFLESGHSYMEVDSMHSSIETAKKNSEVFCMPDYLSIFKRARTQRKVTIGEETFTKMPYKTKEFKYYEFYDLKKLADETIFNRSKDYNGDQVKWLKIKRMKYCKEDTSKIFFNYDMSENFLWMNVAHNNNSKTSQRLYTRAKKQNTMQAQTLQLTQLYNSILPISAAKKKDLLGLCTKKIIPDEYHGWYYSLPTTDTPDCLPEPSIDEESDEN